MSCGKTGLYAVLTCCSTRVAAVLSLASASITSGSIAASTARQSSLGPQLGGLVGDTYTNGWSVREVKDGDIAHMACDVAAPPVLS